MYDNKKQIVNIINFIRGCEPRCETNLTEPVAEQLKLLGKYGLRGTFLFQYDALVSGDFDSLINQMKLAGHETGVWLEIVEPQAKSAGIEWRGRFPWDPHADTGFSVGYTPAERETLIDVLFEKYKDIFGEYPKVMGSWIIDAHSLRYACDKYSLDASCNCKDQWGTDGYTLWGAYYSGAYYPSVNNAFCPARRSETRINVPVFRMLGSDPVYQYDAGLDINTGAADRQGVITLEPVYKDGGGSEKWVDWFLRENYNGKCLSYAYAQVGQENSFGWESMKDGLTMQIEKISALSKSGLLEVETLGESGRYFKEHYALTPPYAVTCESDYLNSQKKSVWYSCCNYRCNVYCDNGTFFIRDIYLFDDSYPERYLKSVCTSPVLQYDTLPCVDGSRFSGGGIRAGAFFCKDDEILSFTDMEYSEPDSESVRLLFSGTQAGNVSLVFSPAGIKCTAEKPDGFCVSMKLGKTDEVPRKIFSDDKKIIAEHNSYQYDIKLGKGSFSDNCMCVYPENGEITLSAGK